jgi:hypothetical protein
MFCAGCGDASEGDGVRAGLIAIDYLVVDRYSRLSTAMISVSV